MTEQNFKFAKLSGNVLKILALVFMVIDHVGLMFFPQYKIFRILGRIALPIFAFMIAEGCKYTKNKLRYFGMIFAMGIIFQIVYYVVEKSTYMCIFITFSTSILMIYALQFFKKQLFSGEDWLMTILSFLLFGASIVGVYFLNKKVSIDYGFWGCMLAVFVALLHADPKDENQKLLKKIDLIPLNVLCLTVGLLLLAHALKGVQIYGLLAIPILLLYSGKRGKYKMKYFFYVFYPLHLVIIYGIAFLL